jgi:hypothetical protein
MGRLVSSPKDNGAGQQLAHRPRPGREDTPGARWRPGRRTRRRCSATGPLYRASPPLNGPS